jgi:hypothetical protein
MRIYNRRDFNAGLFFMAIGVYFAIYAQDYSLGTANRMGPGYFPALLAVIMLALGLTVLVMAFLKVEEQEPPEATDWRGLVLVLGAVLAFALLLPVAGFLIAVLALVSLASAASGESKPKEIAALAVALVVFAIAVFGYGLELQFPIIPPLLVD